jgi:hypothetical protein
MANISPGPMRRLRLDGKNLAIGQFRACDSSTFVVLLWVSTELRRGPPDIEKPASRMPHMPRRYDPSFAERAVSLAGERGLGRAEIAVELGVNLEDFGAWAADDPTFATALADADTRAEAWWLAQPRLAMHSDKPFRIAVWAKAVAQRYGRSAHSSRPIEKALAKPVVLARYEIPDNGKERRPRKPRTSGRR